LTRKTTSRDAAPETEYKEKTKCMITKSRDAAPWAGYKEKAEYMSRNKTHVMQRRGQNRKKRQNAQCPKARVAPCMDVSCNPVKELAFQDRAACDMTAWRQSRKIYVQICIDMYAYGSLCSMDIIDILLIMLT
jgi:hypothetical protein